MLDLRRLRLLRELARRGTITAVAEALSYSPSAVSQQLAALEKEAGVRLLEPVGRRVRLTPQGDLLVAHTQVLLEEMERAEAALAQSLNETVGTLRVAAFQTAVLALVPHALSQLARQHPRCASRSPSSSRKSPSPPWWPASSIWSSARSTPDSHCPAPARPSVTTCSPTNSGSSHAAMSYATRGTRPRTANSARDAQLTRRDLRAMRSSPGAIAARGAESASQPTIFLAAGQPVR
jgi:DNA-binding transcriptional ArsR family regulator